jgi:hypothetical protein
MVEAPAGTCHACSTRSNETASCSCYHDYYPDQSDDGQTVCYPKCPNDCSGNGKCVKGVCQCNKIDVFGYFGDDCSQMCGSKHYNSPQVQVPDKGKLAPIDEEGDCWCRVTTGIQLDAMHKSDWHKFRKSWASDRTYRCTDRGQYCHMVCNALDPTTSPCLAIAMSLRSERGCFPARHRFMTATR